MTKTDFADWLSPMLVKELRQGMRSRIFMAAFYLTQLLMILAVIFNLAAVSSAYMALPLEEFINGLFWFMISVPLIFVMPIRGFGALHGEMKGGTIELVFLTRLTAWRIAAGKWTALMVQTLLLVCSVLPYVLLRYFLGGVNVISDLQTLFLLLLACAVLTAMTIAISPYDSKLVRALFIIGMIIGFQFLLGIMLAFVMSARATGIGMGSSVNIWQMYAGVAAYVPAFIILALEIAASRIAPPAENHAMRKRLLGLYFLLAAIGFATFGGNAEVFYGISLLLLIPVVVDALAEPVVMIKSVHRPFLNRGPWWRLLGGIFTPGWVSAPGYVLLLTLIAGTALFFQGQLQDPSSALDYVSFLGWLVFPAALIRLIMPTTKYFLGLYIALQFFFAALTMLVGMMSGITNDPVSIWLCPIPNCVHLLNAFGQIPSDRQTEFLVVTMIMTGAALSLLMARTITTRRDIRAAVSQS